MDGADTVEALAVRELGEDPDDDDDSSEVSQTQLAPRLLRAREHTIAAAEEEDTSKSGVIQASVPQFL